MNELEFENTMKNLVELFPEEDLQALLAEIGTQKNAGGVYDEKIDLYEAIILSSAKEICGLKTTNSSLTQLKIAIKVIEISRMASSNESNAARLKSVKDMSILEIAKGIREYLEHIIASLAANNGEEAGSFRRRLPFANQFLVNVQRLLIKNYSAGIASDGNKSFFKMTINEIKKTNIEASERLREIVNLQTEIKEDDPAITNAKKKKNSSGKAMSSEDVENVTEDLKLSLNNIIFDLLSLFKSIRSNKRIALRDLYSFDEGGLVSIFFDQIKDNSLVKEISLKFESGFDLNLIIEYLMLNKGLITDLEISKFLPKSIDGEGLRSFVLKLCDELIDAVNGLSKAEENVKLFRNKVDELVSLKKDRQERFEKALMEEEEVPKKKTSAPKKKKNTAPKRKVEAPKLEESAFTKLESQVRTLTLSRPVEPEKETGGEWKLVSYKADSAPSPQAISTSASSPNIFNQYSNWLKKTGFDTEKTTMRELINSEAGKQDFAKFLTENYFQNGIPEATLPEKLSKKFDKQFVENIIDLASRIVTICKNRNELSAKANPFQPSIGIQGMINIIGYPTNSPVVNNPDQTTKLSPDVGSNRRE
jgi:hypothetical protein